MRTTTRQLVEAGTAGPVRWPRPRLAHLVVAVVVATVAFGTRLVPVLRGGGLFGLGNYDDGVYYAAAVGLAHGQLPYRDFLLLHPPGILLVLWPFALLGHLIGDPSAFALARLAFMSLGALNAVLIVAILRRAGLVAALVGGLTYAVLAPAVYIEHTTMLEVPASTCLLAALLIILRHSHRGPAVSGWLVLAGALLGVSSSTKIWGVALAGTVVLWTLVSSGLRRSAVVLVGVGAGVTGVCLPFYLAAPGPMWRLVVLDQLGRLPTLNGAEPRMATILGLTAIPGSHGGVAALTLAVVVTAGCCVLAALSRAGRLTVVVLVAGCVVLLASPSWFAHYTGLTAGPLALVLGSAAGQGLRGLRWCRRRGRVLTARWLAAVALVGVFSVLTYSGVAALSTTFGRPFPAAALQRSVGSAVGCVASDDPAALIELDLLQRNLVRGCSLMVDLGGYTYDLRSSTGQQVRRSENVAWQRFALTYLRSARTSIVMRFRRGAGFSSATARTVAGWPVEIQAGRVTIRLPHATASSQ